MPNLSYTHSHRYRLLTFVGFINVEPMKNNNFIGSIEVPVLDILFVLGFHPTQCHANSRQFKQMKL